MGLQKLRETYKEYSVEKDDYYFTFTYKDLISSVRTINESFDHVYETIDDLMRFLLIAGFTQKLCVINADLSESREIIINHTYYEFSREDVKIIIGLDGYRYYNLKTKVSSKMSALKIKETLFFYK